MVSNKQKTTILQTPVVLSTRENNDNDNDCIERHDSRVLQSPHCAKNCLQHVRSSWQCAIVCKSNATHRAQLKSLAEFK